MGVVLDDASDVFMVTEYMANGNLVRLFSFAVRFQALFSNTCSTLVFRLVAFDW